MRQKFSYPIGHEEISPQYRVEAQLFHQGDKWQDLMVVAGSVRVTPGAF